MEGGNYSGIPVQEMLFDDRFLPRYAGKIITDPLVAIVELVANAWDAGATRVNITWDASDERSKLVVADNGSGMSPEQFDRRWRTLDYDRRASQGAFAEFPHGVAVQVERPVFGQNGRGRHAGFCFADAYSVDTAHKEHADAAGVRSQWKVARSTDRFPLKLEKTSESLTTTTGTTITVDADRHLRANPGEVKAHLSMRFLADPTFTVFVNGEKVDFGHIPTGCVTDIPVPMTTTATPITIRVIDAEQPDKSTRLHGIAWWVTGRLVGRCEWPDWVDGRFSEAKRYTFIVFADALDGTGSVLPDWTGFVENSPQWQEAETAVRAAIKNFISDTTKFERQRAASRVKEAHRDTVKHLPMVTREVWGSFVDNVVEQCPGISEKQLLQLSGILARLEESRSQYGLLEQLGKLEPDDLDALHDLLLKWNVRMAKVVLDELEGRLVLIQKLKNKTGDRAAHEVQELQPLFEKGLWIFGNEFESIEYTSNRAMVTVVQELLGTKLKKSERLALSSNRPDFVVLPDATAGFYSLPDYDDNFDEVGTRKLVIVELKRPGIAIGSDEKNQAWGYVKELLSTGHIRRNVTDVKCYVLGSLLDPDESEPMRQGDRVEILPMLYDTVLSRANSRTFKLLEKVKAAPVIADALKQDLEVVPGTPLNLFAAVK
jgi:hypothetical protein